eukprot:5606387-Pleurochrysis_carterae.AAC.1
MSYNIVKHHLCREVEFGHDQAMTWLAGKPRRVSSHVSRNLLYHCCCSGNSLERNAATFRHQSTGRCEMVLLATSISTTEKQVKGLAEETLMQFHSAAASFANAIVLLHQMGLHHSLRVKQQAV